MMDFVLNAQAILHINLIALESSHEHWKYTQLAVDKRQVGSTVVMLIAI